MRMKHDPPNPTIQRMPTSIADLTVILDFNRKSLDHIKSVSSIFVGVTHFPRARLLSLSFSFPAVPVRIVSLLQALTSSMHECAGILFLSLP